MKVATTLPAVLLGLLFYVEVAFAAHPRLRHSADISTPLVLVEEEIEGRVFGASVQKCVKIEDPLGLLGCSRKVAIGSNSSKILGKRFAAGNIYGFDIEHDIKPALENLMGIFECYATTHVGPQVSDKLTPLVRTCLRNVACDAVLPRCSVDCAPQFQCRSTLSNRIKDCIGTPLFNSMELEHFMGSDLVAECTSGTLENLKGDHGKVTGKDVSMSLTKGAKNLVNALANSFAHMDTTWAITLGVNLTHPNHKMNNTLECQDGLLWESVSECPAIDRVAPEETSEQEEEIEAAGGDPDADVTDNRDNIPVVWSGEPDTDILPAIPAKPNVIKHLAKQSNATNKNTTGAMGTLVAPETSDGAQLDNEDQTLLVDMWTTNATVIIPGLSLLDFSPDGFASAMAIELGVQKNNIIVRKVEQIKPQEQILDGQNSLAQAPLQNISVHFSVASVRKSATARARRRLIVKSTSLTDTKVLKELLRRHGMPAVMDNAKDCTFKGHFSPVQMIQVPISKVVEMERKQEERLTS